MCQLSHLLEASKTGRLAFMKDPVNELFLLERLSNSFYTSNKFSVEYQTYETAPPGIHASRDLGYRSEWTLCINGSHVFEPCPPFSLCYQPRLLRTPSAAFVFNLTRVQRLFELDFSSWMVENVS